MKYVFPLIQGKSLSLICGALSWLTDFETKRKQEAAALMEKGQTSLSPSDPEASVQSLSTEPDWITSFVQKKAERDLVSKLKVRAYRRATVWLELRMIEIRMLTLVCFCSVSGG